MESYHAPVLFLDEIHSFNKAQQDFLLPSVENGQIVLIGATTENPSFEVIPPLLSRMRVFVLNPLKDEELLLIIKKALKLLKVKKIDKASEEFLLNYADGDARKLLTIIDNAYALYGNLKLNSLKNALQSKQILYDKKGEEHYNIISLLY
jgi:putative ATPase